MTPEMQKLLDQMEPQMRAAFDEAIQRITSTAQKVLLEAAIAEGNIEKAVAVLQLDASFFAHLDRAFAETQYRAGVMALASLPMLKDPFLVGVWLSALTRGIPAPKPLPGHTPEI